MRRWQRGSHGLSSGEMYLLVLRSVSQLVVAAMQWCTEDVPQPCTGDVLESCAGPSLGAAKDLRRCWRRMGCFRAGLGRDS